MEGNRVLQVATADGLFLHGYYLPSKERNKAVLHIHGFEGNFYENSFVNAIATQLTENNTGFLTVNTRGNGKDTDFNTADGKYRRVGSRYELLEEAHLDINAWIKFLISEGYKEITLMGHSLGTMKIVRYLFEGEFKNKVEKLILISPFDKKSLDVLKNVESVESLISNAKNLVNEGKGEELVVLKNGKYVMSYQTLLSWFNNDDLGRMFEFCTPDYEFPILRQISIPTKIIVGSKDEHFHLSNPEHQEEAMEILLKNISNSKGIIIENARHSFRGFEETLAKEVCDFV